MAGRRIWPHRLLQRQDEITACAAPVMKSERRRQMSEVIGGDGSKRRQHRTDPQTLGERRERDRHRVQRLGEQTAKRTQASMHASYSPGGPAHGPGQLDLGA
jgi:hypothetical protein